MRRSGQIKTAKRIGRRFVVVLSSVETFSTRTIISLKNRFNKVLQAEVNKCVGCLHAALREYHSGWSMTDYTTKAKSDFANKQGKMFKHDIVYDILRRSLPKYEISIDTFVLLQNSQLLTSLLC